MSEELLSWLIGVITSSGTVGFILFLMRDAAAKFVFKSVEHRFDAKLELFKAQMRLEEQEAAHRLEKELETFKGHIRENEKEREKIQEFLSSAQRERDSAMWAKKIEAVEVLFRLRQNLAQFSTLVEYMTILNTRELLKRGNDPKIAQFAQLLIEPFNVDESLQQLRSIDRATPHLYLSETTLKIFDAYELITLSALTMMRSFTIPIPRKDQLINADGGVLRKAITEVVPAAVKGFDKWGDDYGYHWWRYFYEETLKALRNEVSGVADFYRDKASAERVYGAAREAQTNVRISLEAVGLPDTLVKSNEEMAAHPSDKGADRPAVGKPIAPAAHHRP